MLQLWWQSKAVQKVIYNLNTIASINHSKEVQHNSGHEKGECGRISKPYCIQYHLLCENYGKPHHVAFSVLPGWSKWDFSFSTTGSCAEHDLFSFYVSMAKIFMFARHFLLMLIAYFFWFTFIASPLCTFQSHANVVRIAFFHRWSPSRKLNMGKKSISVSNQFLG